MTDDDIAQVLQLALLDEVSTDLRGVGFDRGQGQVVLKFFYSSDVSEEDRESASIVETELLAALPSSITVRCELHANAARVTADDAKRFVFLRRSNEAR